MPEALLQREPFLGDYSRAWDDTRLEEITRLAIVSVAIPQGGKDDISRVLTDRHSVELPGPGSSSASPDGLIKIFYMSPDQLFVLFEEDGTSSVEMVGTAFGDAGYLTDQSDNWVALGLVGPLAVPALERVCPLDLHPAAFPDGAVARTVMEHMGTIIHRRGPLEFLLLSSSSSARSFLHAIEVSIGNVLDPAA